MADKKRKPFFSGERWTADYIILWVIVVVSLLMNLFTLRQLAQARNAARQAVADTIATIEELEKTSISTTVKIDQTIVIDTDLPVDEAFPVEIKDSFPIDTVLAVPVDAGLLGKLNLNIPIKTTIPVDVKPTVTINQTFHVKAPVPLKLDVPIQIDVASTGLGPMLANIKTRLVAIAQQLDGGSVPQATPEVR